MSGRGRLTLCALAATLMAAGALLPLVDPATWILQAAFLVAVQSGVGALARRVPLARPLTVLAQALVSLLLLTLLFARDRAVAGVLPGPDTFVRFGELLRAGGNDVATYMIPAPDTPGIRLMVVGGVVVIGLAVDALAVTFRSAAPAGLPLLALYSVAAGLAGGGSGWLWFLLAAAGYLLLLLAEGRDRLSQWGRVFGGAPRRDTPGFDLAGGGSATAPVRTGRRIGAVALGIALAVPAVLPSLEGGLLGGSGPGSGRGGGGTISAVNPLVSLQDNLNQPENREVLKYQTNAADTSDMYLRLVALDQFDGTSWKSSERPIKDVPERLPTPDGLAPDVDTTEVVTNLSAAPSYQQKWLPMPYPATQVKVPGRWRYEPAGRMLVGDDKQDTGGVKYTVTSLAVRPSPQQLASAPRARASVVKEYTRVPESLPQDVRATALQVTRGARDDYERAVKLQDWFAVSGGFTYDTQVSSGSGSSAISRFLKDKRGFCVHFSFSMASMARTLGIPARVAVGFTPGTPLSDGVMSVGLRDAHAWPELYFEGVGWTRFEPTPTRGTMPAYTQEQAPSDGASDPAQPSASSSAQPSAKPSVSDSCPPEARRAGDCGEAAAPGAAGPGDPGLPLGPLLWGVLGAVLLVGVPLLPMVWRSRVRAARLGSPGRTPRETATRVLAAWREVVDTAWDHGILPDESRTPRSTAERIVRLGRLDGEAAEAVHRVASAVEQVLYAPRPRPVSGLTEDARLVREGLRAPLGRPARLRALLAPRSAVRVVWGASDRWTATTARWSRRRTSLLTRLPSLPHRPSRQRS
ncbi:DUF3488 and transglutaminase-like domain-containing protein [Streptomyces sp. NPDC001941]|uniref:transglutaminase TgpA family protein n=1 Tax=Streptomyces sp. NPDC001941 TaxID=3154659 RepID=UPI00331802A7